MMLSLKIHGIFGFHAEIWSENDQSYDIDSCSRSGTYVNGQETKLMSFSAGDSPTNKSIHGAGKKVPAWVYGLGGLVIAGLALAYFLFGNQLGSGFLKQQAKQLHGSRVWSQSLSDSGKNPSTPMLADINGDGTLDVIMVDLGGHLLALDGKMAKRIIDMDIGVPLIAPPVAGDLDGNGIDDIVVATTGGRVFAINGKGKVLWQSQAGLGAGAIVNRPVLVDVNGDGVKDVIVPTRNIGLVALDGKKGTELWNSAYATLGMVVTSPVARDINGDGVMDFIYLTDQGHLTAITSKEGKARRLWDRNVGVSVLNASPVYVKAGEKGLIVVGTNGKGIMAFKAGNGSLAWKSKVKGRFLASPVSADANGDGVADAVVVSMKGKMHLLNGLTGKEIWSADLGSGMRATPALFDLNGNGLPDIILLDTSGNILAFDMASGRNILKMSVPGSSDGFVASPVLGDLTGQGMLDVVCAAQNGKITALRINSKVGKGKAPWPLFLGNNRHGL